MTPWIFYACIMMNFLFYITGPSLRILSIAPFGVGNSWYQRQYTSGYSRSHWVLQFIAGSTRKINSHLYFEKLPQPNRTHLTMVRIICLLTYPWTSLLDGPASFWKIWKCHFFQDIQNIFQWATGIGLEPNQNFFRKKIPTNAVARAVQSFGQNGLWPAGWLSNGQNFDVNLAESPDKEMLKISRR